jgi:hypothetical protein
MQKNHSAEALDVSVVWPWFAGGALTPVLADALSGPLASFLAAGLSFFLCFAVASSLVSRNAGEGGRFARNLLASAAGGVIVSTLTYAFQ